jgi:hypothetical protein
MNYRDFLNILYGSTLNGKWLLIWDKTTKRSNWFEDTESAAQYLDCHNEEVYIGAGLSPENFGPSKRCTAGQICGVPGLYADIDVKDAVHKAERLPESIEEGIWLVNQIGLAPTIIVHTGHGLQAWWLFRGGVIDTRSADIRKYAARLNQRLSIALKTVADTRGWVVDSVFDLARILRPPGTFNCKSQCIETKTVHYDPAAVYSLLELEETLPEIDDAASNSGGSRQVLTDTDREVVAGEIVLSPTAEPDPGLFEILNENEAGFRAVWTKRKAFPSTSEYHMSIANYAAMYDWAPQQIANLIIAWNRRHEHDMAKPMRPAYMTETIAKAMKSEAERARRLADGNAKVMGPGPWPEPEARTEEATSRRETAGQGTCQPAAGSKEQNAYLSNIESLTGLKIVRFIKQDQSPPSYIIEILTNGTVQEVCAESIDVLESPTIMRRKFIEVINGWVELDKKTWRKALKLLWNVVNLHKPSGVETLDERLADLLEDYIDQSKIRPVGDDVIDNGWPFFTGGTSYIRLNHFKAWVSRQGETWKLRDLTATLSKLGFREGKPYVPYDSGQKQVRAWAIPQNFCPAGWRQDANNDTD